MMLIEGINKGIGNVRTDEQRAYTRAATAKWRRAHPEKAQEWGRLHPGNTTRYYHKIGRTRPLGENKACASYLGVFVVERLLGEVFQGVQRMPACNPGYDFICKNGYKIVAKSSCRRYRGDNFGWGFSIKQNKAADYFACMAFRDRESLLPEHFWLVPGALVNEKSTFWVPGGEGILNYIQFEKPLYKVLDACDLLRGGL